MRLGIYFLVFLFFIDESEPLREKPLFLYNRHR